MIKITAEPLLQYLNKALIAVNIVTLHANVWQVDAFN